MRGLALSVVPGVAGASTTFTPYNQGGWGHWNAGGARAVIDLSLVHGIQGLDVDIYVVKNFSSYKELPDVHFGTAADLTTTFPGWVTPGRYIVDVVPPARARSSHCSSRASISATARARRSRPT